MKNNKFTEFKKKKNKKGGKRPGKVLRKFKSKKKTMPKIDYQYKQFKINK